MQQMLTGHSNDKRETFLTFRSVRIRPGTSWEFRRSKALVLIPWKHKTHGSLNVPIEHHPTITVGIWSLMATIRWCPIFPKWDIYQPLKHVGPWTITTSCKLHTVSCLEPSTSTAGSIWLSVSSRWCCHVAPSIDVSLASSPYPLVN